MLDIFIIFYYLQDIFQANYYLRDWRLELLQILNLQQSLKCSFFFHIHVYTKNMNSIWLSPQSV